MLNLKTADDLLKLLDSNRLWEELWGHHGSGELRLRALRGYPGLS